jgi:hypothetical protein
VNWSDYYKSAFNVDDKEKIALSSKLKKYGPANEVCFVAGDFLRKEFCDFFIKSAFAAGVRFSGCQLHFLKSRLSYDYFCELLIMNGRPVSELLFRGLDEDHALYAVEKLGLVSDQEDCLDEFGKLDRSKMKPPTPQDMTQLQETMKTFREDLKAINTKEKDESRTSSKGKVIVLVIVCSILALIIGIINVKDGDSLMMFVFWSFIFIISTWLIQLSFYNDAKAGDPLAGRIHFVLGLCIAVGVIVLLIALITAVRL